MGGLAVLSLLAGLVFWKTRRPAPRTGLVAPIGEDPSVGQPEPKPEQVDAYQSGGNQAGYPRIRYPDEEESNLQTASGRTNDEY